MNRTATIAALLAAALCLPFVLGSARAGEAAATSGGGLEDNMQDVQAAAKALDKALGAEGPGDLPKALTAVLQMEAAVVSAREHTPPKAEELKDAAAKAEMIKGFRLELIGLHRALLDVESAIVEGRVDVARKLVSERVKPAKKAGHEKYKGD